MKDLTGMRFGRWTVLGFSHREISEKGSYNYYWKCKCDCGTVKNVNSIGLKSGRSKSCGCLRDKLLSEMKILNIKGKRFGSWTVNSFHHRDKNGHLYWKCKCDCGNIKVVLGTHLTSGRSKNCGCVRDKLASERGKQTWKQLQDGLQKYSFKNTIITALTSKIPSNNTSGFKGVYWLKSRNKWCARITIQGNTYNLGHFINKEDAIKARKEAEEKYFKPIIEEFEEKQGSE